MHAPRTATSPADAAQEASTLLAGLVILTIQLFPFTLPLLVLVVAPLALMAAPVLVMAGILVLPFWLARAALRSRARRRSAAGSPREARLAGQGALAVSER